MLCALAVMLAATGCSTTNEPAEDNSSSSVVSSEQLPEESGDEPENKTADEEQDAETESSSDGSKEADASGAADDNQDQTSSAPSQAPASNTSSAPAASTPPATTSSTPAPAASQAPAQPTAAAPKTTSGNGALAKYTVNVKDSSTPATDVKGQSLDGASGYVFYSANGKVLGIIPNDIIPQIIQDNGLTYAEIPEQKAWFVEQFNIYRGLGEDTGSAGDSKPSQSSGSSNSDIDIDEYRDEVIRLTNIEREKAGLDPVTADDTAMEYAQIRAEEISTNYSHNRPNNKDNALDGLYFIENIVRGSTTPERAVSAWMNSSGHKATLLSDYSEVGNRIGVGCYQADDGKIYWTQEFVGWDSEG